MSYLETGKGRFTWIPTPIPTSTTRPEIGCVQCGSRLENVDLGKRDFTGKCVNCTGWISDDDEIFDDLED
jgi:hypothetical protein